MQKYPKKPLALITGSAVRLGRSIAISLAEKNFAIGLHYFHSEKEAELLAEELQENGVEVLLLPGDLRNPEDILQMAEKVRLSGYPLKVLVNSAAIMPSGEIMDAGLDQWDEVMDINLRAVWLLTKALRPLLEENSGVIINISDSGTNKIWLQHPIYLLSKNSMESLTKIMAKSLAPKIRVNAVAPGLVYRSDSMTREQWNRMTERMPLKGSIPTHDINTAINFCIQNDSLTGQIIVVDKGFQLI